jgi:hypothetical protein
MDELYFRRGSCRLRDYTKEAARLRISAAQCRELAETATGPDTAKSLSALADEIETLILTILKIDGRAPLDGGSMFALITFGEARR